MLPALGALITPAMGIAISPVIIVLTTMLLASGRVLRAVLFVLGSITGVFITVTASYLLSTGADAATDDDVRAGISLVKLGLGLLFAALAVRTWRHRPRPGEEPGDPRLIRMVAQMSWWQALGTGFALVTVAAPKNLALGVGAGAALALEGLKTSTSLVLIVVFAVLSLWSALLPLAAAALFRDRVAASLDALMTWLVENNTAIMLVLFAVLSAWFVGQGLGLAG